MNHLLVPPEQQAEKTVTFSVHLRMATRSSAEGCGIPRFLPRKTGALREQVQPIDPKIRHLQRNWRRKPWENHGKMVENHGTPMGSPCFFPFFAMDTYWRLKPKITPWNIHNDLPWNLPKGSHNFNIFPKQKTHLWNSSWRVFSR